MHIDKSDGKKSMLQFQIKDSTWTPTQNDEKIKTNNQQILTCIFYDIGLFIVIGKIWEKRGNL